LPVAAREPPSVGARANGIRRSTQPRGRRPPTGTERDGPPPHGRPPGGAGRVGCALLGGRPPDGAVAEDLADVGFLTSGGPPCRPSRRRAEQGGL